MNIVYVSRLLTWDGPELVGRSLVRHLSAEHTVRMRGGIVPDDSPLLDGHLAQDLVSESELVAADIVYMEGGWNRDDGSPDRFPQGIADEFVRRGGQLIVADIDRNVAKDDAAVLESSRGLLGTVPTPNSRGVQYLEDEEAREFGNVFRLAPGRMHIDDSLARVWDGIDSVLVESPVVLAPLGSIVASGHEDSWVLVDDHVVLTGSYWPWAMMKQHGLGHVITIGGWVSADPLVDACPDNARWVSNLVTHLADRTQENSTWRGGRLFRHSEKTDRPSKGPSDVGEEIRRIIEGGESRAVEFKSTARKNLRTGDVDPAMELGILKSIAAFMNTDGGTLLVGVADDGSIVGIEEDFPSLGAKRTIDGWELWLTDLLSASLGQTATMNTIVTYGHVAGATVAKIEITPTPRPVFVTPKKGERRPVFYVRMNSSTRELLGLEAVDYQRKRWPAL